MRFQPSTLLIVLISACGFSPTSEGALDGAVVAPVDAGSSTRDSGAVDAGSARDAGMADAGMNRAPISGPITAPNQTWTWVDFPDSECGNGVATGIGINPNTASTDLWIYMQGGGACWENYTCFVFKSATNITEGYTAATWDAEPHRGLPGFTRTRLDNPFKDASFVFVPYCTGDVHAGSSVQTFAGGTVHFSGALNVAAYLKRLKATFPQTQRVFLTGSSAGAFGAQLNFTQVAQAFPQAQIHVLADSGQMINPSGSFLSAWVSTWNLTVPASCVDCLTNFPKYIDWLSVQKPASRIALLAYSQDQVLRNFFGLMAVPYQTQTELLLGTQFDAHANTKYFYLYGDSHTMLGSQFSITHPNGSVKLNDWLTAWYTGTNWSSIKPQ